MSGLTLSASEGALWISGAPPARWTGTLPAWTGTALPLAPTDGVPGVGFDVAGGEPALLDEFHAQLEDVAGALEWHGVTIRLAAECVAPVWRGEAASSYAALSGLVSTHFHRAAGSLREGSAAVRRFAAELRRCQDEGRLAYSEADHWIGEIAAQTRLLAAAGRDVAGAERALSVAHARLATARAAGPLGVVTAAATEVQAAAAQAGLALAAQQAQAAQNALDHAHGQLSVWQARGRRAWEDAQHAAERATGTLDPLLIVAPPLAGLPVPVVSPIAPFAMPPGLSPEACGDGENSTLSSREPAAGALARLAAALGSKFPAIAALLAAAASAANAVDQETDSEAAAIAEGDGPAAAAGIADTAETVGARRVQAVVNYYGDDVVATERKVTIPGEGSTDVDVELKGGTYIEVGGPSKADDLSSFGQQLRRLRAYADSQGGTAKFLYAGGTPQSAIQLAVKWLGPANVGPIP